MGKREVSSRSLHSPVPPAAGLVMNYVPMSIGPRRVMEDAYLPRAYPWVNTLEFRPR